MFATSSSFSSSTLIKQKLLSYCGQLDDRTAAELGERVGHAPPPLFTGGSGAVEATDSIRPHKTTLFSVPELEAVCCN